MGFGCTINKNLLLTFAAVVVESIGVTEGLSLVFLQELFSVIKQTRAKIDKQEKDFIVKKCL
jgi:hypothetical protein